jgi:putative transposase
MSRPLRIEYPDAWYHVMNRGRRGEDIFSAGGDYELFVHLLREAAQAWNVRVAAFCLMTNHYHLLMQTPEANLSRCMRHVDGVYTQRYNRAHRCDGSLFRGRYRAILVEADLYLLPVLKYIHRNPLRAGVVKNLEAYEWSSHRGYLSRGRRWNWLSKEFILGMFQKERGSGLEAYRRFIGEEDGADILRVFEGKKWPTILGGAGFVREIKERFFTRLQHREVPESRVLAPAAEDILKVVCEAYGVGKDKVLRPRRGEFNEARNVAIYLTRELRHATLDDICGPFGMGRYSSASSAVGRVKVQLARDRRLEKRVQKIIGELCKRQT